MKVLVLAGALAAVAFPTAAAAEAVAECQSEDARSALTPDRAEPTVAPAPPAARQAAAQRETSEARTETARRRNGKRVPDAELIGPRGAL